MLLFVVEARSYLLFEESDHAAVPRHPQQVDVLSLGKPAFRSAVTREGRVKVEKYTARR